MKLEESEFWREIEEADKAIEEEVREAVEERREGWTKEGRVLIWKKQLYVLGLTPRREFFYHKWSLTICDGCFDTLKSSKMRS